MKRFLALIFSLIFIASLSLPSFAIDDPPEVEKCQSAYLYSFANNRVLYEYNPEKRVYPTSTVKIMTGLLALEHFAGALDTEVTVTKEMLSKVKGNKLSPSLTAGEVVTVEQMLYGCLVGGANDAAYVLAYATSGNVESFITDMNAKAALIGAYSTKYTNPTGMHDDAMYTTARDTAQIAIYAQKNEDFVVRKGPIFANFVLADEINRAPAKVQSALLEAMQERQVTIGNETFQLPWASTQEPPRPADIARCR